MSRRKFTEDTRVKIPAAIQFMRLGYDYLSLKDAEYDTNTNIFYEPFKKSLEKINNKTFSDEDIEMVINDIHRISKNNDLGKEFYNWLTNPLDKVKLIDFDDYSNNIYQIVTELTYGDEKGFRFRPDITILINGMPLSFLEVKPPNNRETIQGEFNRMLNQRLKEDTVAKYFNLLQIVSFSNNMEYEDVSDSVPAEDIKFGSFYATPNGQKTFFSFFREEEKLDIVRKVSNQEMLYVLDDNNYDADMVFATPEFRTNIDKDSPLNSFTTSLYSIERVMFFLQYGIMYLDGETPQRHIMRYPQFFASKRIKEKLEQGDKSGIIWHTQGSGKTALAAYANRVVKDYYAKQGIVARFFFVVDRLDLLTQSSNEFTSRGFTVTSVNSKSEFATELDRPRALSMDKDSIGEFCVINIHKFGSDFPEAKNDYGTKVQRIFFIDEAHRSYKMSGEFFKNLISVDNDAVYIALTGTPLLSKKERSNLKFGDYIHKYFYDKSIADGYTLRIKKEQIDTQARIEIKRNLDLENPELTAKELYESDDYIASLGKFIDSDFNDFRYINEDKSIGGMVVCSSNPQAVKVNDWINENTELSSQVVISNSDEFGNDVNNREVQNEFKYSGQPDILVVHQMLTTGYDVPRLKKMYLLRNAKEHTLLQTISRVNRPYRNEHGKQYDYGYIVDFVDISDEYERTIEAYIKELEEEMRVNGEDEGSLEGLIVGPEDIYERYKSYLEKLEKMVDELDNVEKFSQEIRTKKNQELHAIRATIKNIRKAYVEFKISRAEEYANEIDDEHMRLLYKEVDNRIRTINLKSRPLDTIKLLNNKEIVDIVYEFIKSNVIIMNLALLIDDPNTTDVDAKKIKEIIGTVEKIQKEAKKNKNDEQLQLIKLDEFLKQIFERLDFATLQDLDSISYDLNEVYEEMLEINEENDRLASIYDGKFSYVKTYQNFIEENPNYNESRAEKMFVILNKEVDELLKANPLLRKRRSNFIIGIKKNVTKILLKEGLFRELELTKNIDLVLNQLYTNLLKFKEMEDY